MNKQQLASKIWESANRMRSKIEANEYKDYILGFIFYKFLSDNELKFLKSAGIQDKEIQTVKEENEAVCTHIKQNLGYFIAYENLFSTWLTKGSDFNVSNVRDAISAFNRLINPSHKKVFDKIFDTLSTGLSKLGDTAQNQTKAISGLINLIKDIPMDGRQDYDVLGFVYEYLISMFAANAGKKAGEFYTPHEVSVVMSEIIANHLKARSKIEIYDPTSGSGSLLLNIGKSVAKHISDKNKIKYYAQELKANTYNLTRMNLVMKGILPDNIVVRNGDTLEDDWPYFEEDDQERTYNPLFVDAVVSNPPYSQKWEPKDKESDARFSDYGLAPKSKADFAFLLHDLYHLKNNGIMTIVLPHGVLFRGGEEGKIRKQLIEKNRIDAIIGLPANIFFGTGIPTIIMVLKKERTNTDVLIVDASKGFVKVGKNNKLRACDIKKIVDTVINRTDIDKYSKVVSKEEIRNNEYNLNIPRYVDSSIPAESYDLYASMFGGIPQTEIDNLQQYWNLLPTLQNDLFKKVSSNYCTIKTDNLFETLQQHKDVTDFKNNFSVAFKIFDKYLEDKLLKNIKNIDETIVLKQETVIATEIFNRIKDFAIVDKYSAYQILDDIYQKIAIDLEIIQTEGFDSTKKVIPNMVVKKKDKKEVEVQEGWLGNIIPFELVQQTILKKEYEDLKPKQDRLQEIQSSYGEIIESLEEEDKETVLNDDNDAFVTSKINTEYKSIEKDIKKGVKVEENSIEDTIVKVYNLMQEEKKLKADVKKQSGLLEEKTIKTIESLKDEQVIDLLKLKWIKPIVEGLKKIPFDILDELTQKIKVLSEKYITTYSDIEKDMAECETELSKQIEELTGDKFDTKALEELKKLLERK